MGDGEILWKRGGSWCGEAADKVRAESSVLADEVLIDAGLIVQRQGIGLGRQWITAP
jgi:hypothetical protein